MRIFKDRKEAGKLLAEKLTKLKKEHPIILGIPRGGVPVAFEIAQTLQAPLDVLVVKKLGSPFNPELALGAVSEEGRPWINEALVKYLKVQDSELEKICQQKSAEALQQVRKFRAARSRLDIKDHVLILVDDGVATGATLLAAISLLKMNQPKKIIVAIPVAPESTLKELRNKVDLVICLQSPQHFFAVGSWYQNFEPVSDEEVRKILQGHQETEIESRGHLFNAQQNHESPFSE